jgi:hypothetical protein
MKHHQIAVGLALCAGCFSAGAQSVVFTSGPVNGTLIGYTINQGWAVADSFTLAAPATIGSASFGAWIDTGDTLTSVDWAIASSAFGPALASGTALNPASTFVTTSSSGDNYTIDSDSFSIQPVSLGAGTYYFELQNAQTAENNAAYWDENDSADSTGVQSYDDSNPGDHPGESFTLFAPAPEPGALALAGVGSLIMLAVRRKK